MAWTGQISSVAYHSWRETESKDTNYPVLHLQLFVMWQPQQTSPATLSVSYCVSVLSSRDFCDMWRRNKFFCKEWSLTRQFSTRRSDTGEWSMTVNLPPLEKITAQKRKTMKDDDEMKATIKDYVPSFKYHLTIDFSNITEQHACVDSLFL